MSLSYHPEVVNVLWNKDISNEEKVGLVLRKAKFKSDLLMEEVLRLRSLIQWAGVQDIPSCLNIWWDESHRVMKLSFDKSDYFNRGGRAFFADLAEASKSTRRCIAISSNRSPFWLVHFPQWIGERPKKEEPVEERSENEVLPDAKEEKKVEEAKPPKTVRNRQRKAKIEEPIPFSDQDEEDVRDW